jgi:hypothetical protein
MTTYFRGAQYQQVCNTGNTPLQVLPALEAVVFLLGELRGAAAPAGGGQDALGLTVSEQGRRGHR